MQTESHSAIDGSPEASTASAVVKAYPADGQMADVCSAPSGAVQKASSSSSGVDVFSASPDSRSSPLDETQFFNNNNRELSLPALAASKKFVLPLKIGVNAALEWAPVQSEQRRHDTPHQIFVGGLARGTTGEALREHFERYFEVLSARVVRDRDGISKGFGFVMLTSEADAEAAINMGHRDRLLMGRRLNVARAFRREQPASRREPPGPPLNEQGGSPPSNNLSMYVTVIPSGEVQMGVPAEFVHHPLLFTTPPDWYLERRGYPVYVKQPSGHQHKSLARDNSDCEQDPFV